MKPATLLHKDFSDSLIELINNCGLPPFVIKDTLRCALYQVENLVDDQYRKDMKEYEESQLLGADTKA